MSDHLSNQNGSLNGINGHQKGDITSKPQRVLTIIHSQSSTRIQIPFTPELIEDANEAKDSFLKWSESNQLVGLDGEVEAEEKVKGGRKELMVMINFLNYLCQSNDNFSSSLVLQIYNHFTSTYLISPSKISIQSLALNLSNVEYENFVIKTYYQARWKILNQGLESKIVHDGKDLGKNGLINAGNGLEVWAIFGGQGVNEIYWEELETLYSLYGPLLLPFLSLASPYLSNLSTSSRLPPSASIFHPFPLTPLEWLLNPSSKPSVSYFRSVPISMPLISLIQYCRYIVFGKANYLGPKELGKVWKTATGHSQGIVNAVVIGREYEEVKYELVGGEKVDLPSLEALEEAWKPFYESALSSLAILFSIGIRGSIFLPPSSLPPSFINPCVEAGEGVPTPMLSISGLTEEEVQKRVDGHNKNCGEDGKVMISLKNGVKNFVVTGEVRGLVGFVGGVRKGKVEDGKDQSKVPFSQRLPSFSLRFLPIDLPFHSSKLSPVIKTCLEEDLSKELTSPLWSRESIILEVRSTETGRDLRTPPSEETDKLTPSTSLVEELVTMILERPMEFHKLTCKFPKTTTHAIDFGPGGRRGILGALRTNAKGTGVRVVGFNMSGKEGVEAWKTVEEGVAREERWEDRWRAGLVKSSDGKIHIDTPMSRLLRKPPLMVAGMTPTTVQAGFNIAVLNAGYHIELAGGGHYNPKAVRSKVDEIMKGIKPGLGLTLNTLYINPKQWAFQFPLWCQMKTEGLPIEGFCVAAGIPSTEKAKEVIDALKEAGIKHVSFKPGSIDGIRQVVNIASNNPDFPIILQWTGGRAGGHHSYEDFFQPIIETYPEIRAKKNIVLVAGSGFGSWEDTIEYLTGDWSVKRFGLEPMPYDGFLFASRVMVAKESHTSEKCRELIVKAPGVDDSKWEGTYTGPTGGIITVRSELGEAIHKVANRGLRLWKEFDDTVFALPKEKRVTWLNEKKDYVIKRLNADFQKPWFGENKAGKPCDVGDMEYETVTRRMVRLCYVAHEKRWIDVSLRNLVGDWLRRVEERMSPVNGSTKTSTLQSYNQLQDPFPFLETFFNEKYPAARDQILASEDIAYFLNICQRPGQKPVPFIPVLDASFEVWFKKDSLWQSEDIEAVFDQDPERVAILQGPVAVKWSTRTDEPVGEILGNIEKGLIKVLLERYYDNDESKIPVVDYFGEKPTIDSEEKKVKLLEKNGIKFSVEDIEEGKKVYTYQISKALPSKSDWLEALSGPEATWLRAILTNLSIVQEKQIVDNPVKRIMEPRSNQKVKVTVNKEGKPLKLEVFGGTRNA